MATLIRSDFDLSLVHVFDLQIDKRKKYVDVNKIKSRTGDIMNKN